MRKLTRVGVSLLFLVVGTDRALADARKSVTLRLDGRDAVFAIRDSLLVSENCPKACLAVEASRKASEKAATADAIADGGANPGSLICAGIGGEPRPAEELDSDGSVYGERSVCVFGDGSMITVDSLHARAAQNDRIGRPSRR